MGSTTQLDCDTCERETAHELITVSVAGTPYSEQRYYCTEHDSFNDDGIPAEADTMNDNHWNESRGK